MELTKPVIGILGAGKLGITLGQLARRAGYAVYIAGSGPAEKIALSVNVLVPGAVAVTALEAAQKSDIVILALPLSKYKALPKKELVGKLVIDAMNYWWEVDGPQKDLIPEEYSSSEMIQVYLSQSRVVKALNHMGYHDLYDETALNGGEKRKAIAVAGDDLNDTEQVSAFIKNIGFEPVYIGVLSEGRKLEAGTKAFGANLSATELLKLIN